MTPEEYKKLSIKEFTEAAKVYDSGHAGIYEMCKDDYPPILAELEKEAFTDVLDCGCGTGPCSNCSMTNTRTNTMSDWILRLR